MGLDSKDGKSDAAGKDGIEDVSKSGDNGSWLGARVEWPMAAIGLVVVVAVASVVFAFLWRSFERGEALSNGARDSGAAYSIYEDAKNDESFVEFGDFRKVNSAYAYKKKMWHVADPSNNDVKLKTGWGMVDLDVFGSSELPFTGVYSEGAPASYLHIKYSLNEYAGVPVYARDLYCVGLVGRLENFDAVYVSGRTVKNVLDDEIRNDRIIAEDVGAFCKELRRADYSITAVMAAKPVPKALKSNQ